MDASVAETAAGADGCPANAGATLAPFAIEASTLLKVLGHEGRLTVVGHLRDGRKTVRELEALMDCPQPVVSGHLARLRFEGLVSFEREGRTRTYALVDERTRRMVDLLTACFRADLRPLPRSDGEGAGLEFGA